jgi:hypothetical protein
VWWSYGLLLRLNSRLLTRLRGDGVLVSRLNNTQDVLTPARLSGKPRCDSAQHSQVVPKTIELTTIPVSCLTIEPLLDKNLRPSATANLNSIFSRAKAYSKTSVEKQITWSLSLSKAGDLRRKWPHYSQSEGDANDQLSARISTWCSTKIDVRQKQDLRTDRLEPGNAVGALWCFAYVLKQWVCVCPAILSVYT